MNDLTLDFPAELDRLYAAKREGLRYMGMALRRIRREKSELFFRPSETDLALWSSIEHGNRQLLEVHEQELDRFLDRYVRNLRAARHLHSLFYGPGASKTGSMAEAARAENAFLTQYLPLARSLSEREALDSDFDPAGRSKIESCLKGIGAFRSALSEDLALYRRFSKGLTGRCRERLAVNVLGTGEITTTFELTGNPLLARPHPKRPGDMLTYAYKKMPPFKSSEEVDQYISLYHEYHELIAGTLRIGVPLYEARVLRAPDGGYYIYDLQERLPPESIGSRVIGRVSASECHTLFRMILGELRRVFAYNREGVEPQIGFDGQIPNWAVAGFDPSKPLISGNEQLLYIDTTTPLLRRNGVEQLDAEVFMRPLPRFSRSFIRRYVLQGVLDRYYTPRLIVLDLISNCIHYGRRDIVPRLVEIANGFFIDELGEAGFRPYTVREIRRYYRQDRLIWTFFQASRRLAKRLDL